MVLQLSNQDYFHCIQYSLRRPNCIPPYYMHHHRMHHLQYTREILLCNQDDLYRIQYSLRRPNRTLPYYNHHHRIDHLQYAWGNLRHNPGILH